MAQYLINDTTLTALGDKVREKTGETSQLSLDNIINTEVDKVFDAGKKSEYDAFWDEYFKAIKSLGGFGAFIFSGAGWNDITFNPPYPIDFITDGYNMFYYASNISKEKLALVDYSKITSNFAGLFGYSQIKEVPELDTRGASQVSNLFIYALYLVSVENIILKDDGTQTLSGIFNYANALQEVRFTGVIGKNGINVQWSPLLSHESLMSIINALQDKSTDTSGTVWTVTLGATNIAKLTDAEQQIARDKGWVIE